LQCGEKSGQGKPDFDARLGRQTVKTSIKHRKGSQIPEYAATCRPMSGTSSAVVGTKFPSADAARQPDSRTDTKKPAGMSLGRDMPAGQVMTVEGMFGRQKMNRRGLRSQPQNKKARHLSAAGF
jgi:hypothetical protein